MRGSLVMSRYYLQSEIANMRDDFSSAVKDILAKRVGFRCSNPACRQLTSGPQVDVTKVVNVGVASHITAASVGGPRFDASLTSEERAHPDNGIWLCQNCGKLVDNDLLRYPERILRAWKQQAEQATIREVEGGQSHQAAFLQGEPVHRIIDLLIMYQDATLRVHQSDSQDAMFSSLEKWRSCHPAVWGSNSVRDDTIRNLADPAKEWLTRSGCPHLSARDHDLVEECARVLSGFAVCYAPRAMPNVYSTWKTTEEKLWQQWNDQGERLLAIGDLIARLKELAARAGHRWQPPLQADHLA